MENNIDIKPYINVISSPDIPIFSQKEDKGMFIKYGNGEESIVYKVEKYYEALNEFIRTGIQFENTSKYSIKKIDPFLYDFLKHKYPEYANIYSEIYSDSQNMEQLSKLIDVKYDFTKAIKMDKDEKKIFKYIEGFAKNADFSVSKTPSFMDRFFSRFIRNKDIKMLGEGEISKEVKQDEKNQENEKSSERIKFFTELQQNVDLDYQKQADMAMIRENREKSQQKNEVTVGEKDR